MTKLETSPKEHPLSEANAHLLPHMLYAEPAEGKKKEKGGGREREEESVLEREREREDQVRGDLSSIHPLHKVREHTHIVLEMLINWLLLMKFWWTKWRNRACES